MDSFGEYIRSLRLRRKLLLREVAAHLQVDPSLLSRIEGGLKRPTRQQVIKLATIFRTNVNDMLVHYLSDRVVYELKNERLAIQAMKVAEKKIRYLNSRKTRKA